MIPSVRYLGTWLWIGLLGWAAFLLLLWAPLEWLAARGGDGVELSPYLVLFAVFLGWLLLAGGGTALSRRWEPHGRALEPMARFAGFVRLLLLTAILGLVFRGVLALVPEGEDVALTGFLDRMFEPSWAGIDALLELVGAPTSLGGLALAPFGLFVALVMMGNALRWRMDQTRHAKVQQKFPVPKASQAVETLSEEDEARARAVERKLALSSYAEAKSLLKSTEMELAFLSLDIVGSTGLKAGEDPYVVSQSFDDYRRLVERALRRYGVYKQAWTPDGQMAAFPSPQGAVDCGKEILSALPGFNREVSQLRRPFQLRAGASAGTVSTDDHTPMEAISHSSIDEAGHLQKYAAANSFWISGKLFRMLDDPSGFEPEDREVDGQEVYAWTPEEA